ncbi:MAG: hypothetical protein EBQ96_08895 [Proteobacteria bacterium]|nr:hypothetical protein [Pseudomonadota bacterium]
MNNIPLGLLVTLVVFVSFVSAAIAQQTPEATSSVSSELGVAMPAGPQPQPQPYAIQPGSRGNEGSSGEPQSMPAYNPDAQEHPPIQVETPACGHQELVGKKITDVDMKVFTGPVRVVHPKSPMTMDYNADRINLIVEEGTDFILQVTCG